jgi:hypothetical protein
MVLGPGDRGGNSLYIMGGYASDSIRTMERFNGTSWTPAPELASDRYYFEAVVFGSYLYAVCGTTDDSTGIDSMELFDGVSWSLSPTDAAARFGHGAVVF